MRNRISIRPEEILGLREGAEPGEISRARARLAKLLHPDLQGGQTTAIMQLVNHAVETLLNGEEETYSFIDRYERREEEDDREEREPPNPGVCNHPRKPGFDRCFECSGIKLCPRCGVGYYRPPNDRCRNCRNQGGWNRYGGGRRYGRGRR